MKTFIKKFIPKSVISLYHYILAKAAQIFYGNPSEKLIVIGITGTSGKSTAAEFICSILEHAGFRVGLASTIRFKVAEIEKLNDTKMTMVGRFALQKLLSDMVKASCQYAIVETTSLGVEQSRHIGIHYDALVFTNLYPEHIDAHGSFENYKNAKLKLFRRLEAIPHKILSGEKIPKTLIVNLDDRYSPEFLGFCVDEKYGFTLHSKYDISGVTEVRAKDMSNKDRIVFEVLETKMSLALFGKHNIYNALAAICLGMSRKIALPKIQRGIEAVRGIPGRIELIETGQPFTVIVDYAFEPEAMKKLYDVVECISHKRVIHVLGTTGGGRDKARGEMLGMMAGNFADIVIATNEDPYDDDVLTLINRVVTGAKKSKKINEKNLYIFEERREAIKKALSLALPEDVVLITVKGCEQAIVVADNKKIPWDDRSVVREEIKIFHTKNKFDEQTMK